MLLCGQFNGNNYGNHPLLQVVEVIQESRADTLLVQLKQRRDYGSILSFLHACFCLAQHSFKFKAIHLLTFSCVQKIR